MISFKNLTHKWLDQEMNDIQYKIKNLIYRNQQLEYENRSKDEQLQKKEECIEKFINKNEKAEIIRAENEILRTQHKENLRIIGEKEETIINLEKVIETLNKDNEEHCENLKFLEKALERQRSSYPEMEAKNREIKKEYCIAFEENNVDKEIMIKDVISLKKKKKRRKAFKLTSQKRRKVSVCVTNSNTDQVKSENNEVSEINDLLKDNQISLIEEAIFPEPIEVEIEHRGKEYLKKSTRRQSKKCLCNSCLKPNCNICIFCLDEPRNEGKE